jgi:hypothetical protein
MTEADKFKIQSIIRKLLSDVEIEIGSPIKSHEKVIINVVGRILYTMILRYEDYNDAIHKLFTTNIEKFLSKIDEVQNDIANASNPIRFEDEKQAALFGATGAKYAYQTVFVLCVSVVVLCFGYWGYSVFNQTKQIENLKSEKPTIYNDYFKK